MEWKKRKTCLQNINVFILQIESDLSSEQQ